MGTTAVLNARWIVPCGMPLLSSNAAIVLPAPYARSNPLTCWSSSARLRTTTFRLMMPAGTLGHIYVQAKRNKIPRETIQAFVGAFHGFGATRGVFLTASAFTSGAIEYARSVPSRVILIDGRRLVGLMIKHCVGVQVRQIYSPAENNADFFSFLDLPADPLATMSLQTGQYCSVARR